MAHRRDPEYGPHRSRPLNSIEAEISDADYEEKIGRQLTPWWKFRVEL